ncbi:MAG: FCD domain-containing protein, partial [Bradyrhizobiaceae bacterium]|nr:FCD domain-containing protein [Bradyrhizobiaceae bacterium]
LVDRMDVLVAAGEVSQYYPVNLEFHSELARACGNARLAQMYLSLVRELHIQRYRALATGEVLGVSNAEHRAIVDAVTARDQQRAFAAAYAHIANGISRRAVSANRRPAKG